MMKTLYGLLPFLIPLGVVGAAIWWMLERDMALGAWLLAVLLATHGLVHLLFFVPQPATDAAADSAPEWPFDTSRSWLVSSAGVDASRARLVAVVLVGAAVSGFLLSALATVGLLVPVGWWSALVVGSAAVSALLLVLFFSAQLVLGVAIDAALVVLVATAAWVPTSTGS